jgi:ribosomal protein S18 acetylase RimI-like enzyme
MNYSCKYITYMDNFTDHYIIRPLLFSDYSNNYLSLLEKDFSIRPDTIFQSEFTNYVNNLHDYQQIFVIATRLHTKYGITGDKVEHRTIDNTNIVENIIGSVTIFIETKIIHNFGKVAHVEDVIVDNTYRGKGLGKMLVQKCIDYAQKHDCYKIILNCSDENIPFYEKCGFSKKENEMVLYF